LTPATSAASVLLMRFLDQAAVLELLDLDALIDAVAVAMADLSTGRASSPPRIAAHAGEAGLLAITAWRTAAGSALSVRLLARADAAVLTVLGTGPQAHTHLRLVARVRDFREIRLAGRDPAKVAIDLEAVVELGELVAGTRTGRTNERQRTLYKSVGVAIQDAAAAAVVLDQLGGQ
jgi:alanine dehydrogenase